MQHSTQYYDIFMHDNGAVLTIDIIILEYLF